MPNFPQYQNAALVTYSNYVAAAPTTGTTNANPGDVITVKATANGTGTRTIVLPAVALGGPVCVKLGGAFGSAQVVEVVLSAADLAAGVKIDGGAVGLVNSVKLNNAGDQAVFSSDGSTVYWCIDKFHNTTDSW